MENFDDIIENLQNTEIELPKNYQDNLLEKFDCDHKKLFERLLKKHKELKIFVDGTETAKKEMDELLKSRKSKLETSKKSIDSLMNYFKQKKIELPNGKLSYLESQVLPELSLDIVPDEYKTTTTPEPVTIIENKKIKDKLQVYRKAEKEIEKLLEKNKISKKDFDEEMANIDIERKKEINFVELIIKQNFQIK